MAAPFQPTIIPHLVEVVDHVIRKDKFVLNGLILGHLVQLQAVVWVVTGCDGGQGRTGVEGGVTVVPLQSWCSFLTWPKSALQRPHRVGGAAGALTAVLEEVVMVVGVEAVAMAVSVGMVLMCVWVYGAKRTHGIIITTPHRSTHATHGAVVGPATATTMKVVLAQGHVLCLWKRST